MNQLILLSTLAGLLFAQVGSFAGELPRRSDYRVLEPVSHANLTIFPVVTKTSHSTNDFMTLDEGLRSGEVIVTEAGRITPMIRRPDQYPITRRDGAEVNRLVLVNNSKRPLLLLAGEIVTGGKQDRVVGKDRIVPPHSDPVDLSVFCVEPGRWVQTSANFNSMGTQMAQPSVRKRAMADRDQQKVWSEVRESAGAMAGTLSGPAAEAVGSTSSYARVYDQAEVKNKVDAVAAPIRQSYEGVLRDLRARNAVGVVVAVNGRIIWADLFASGSLLEKYWPKLVRSYAAESLTAHVTGGSGDMQSAQLFLDQMSGTREVVESEPGVYRHTEISAPGFRLFELTSLLPATGFDVHIAKMAE